MRAKLPYILGTVAVGLIALRLLITFATPTPVDPQTRIRQMFEEGKLAFEREDVNALVAMLADDGRYDPEVMAAALRNLPRQHRPSEIVVPGLLEGLENVARLVAPWIERGAEAAARVSRTLSRSA